MTKKTPIYAAALRIQVPLTADTESFAVAKLLGETTDTEIEPSEDGKVRFHDPRTDRWWTFDEVELAFPWLVRADEQPIHAAPDERLQEIYAWLRARGLGPEEYVSFLNHFYFKDKATAALFRTFFG